MDLQKLKIAREWPRFASFSSAWVQHIPFAFAAVDLLRPRTLVELGTHRGDSYCAFCQAVEKLGIGTCCTAVDTWMGDAHSGTHSPTVFDGLRAYHDPLYGHFSRLMRATFDDAAGRFESESIDLLHLDGLHTYEAVRHDFATWLPKMSRRGVMLLHDTRVERRNFGVKRLWEEVSGRFGAFEFLHGNGLGVLAVGGEMMPAFAEFMSRGRRDPERVRSIFAGLGARMEWTRGVARSGGAGLAARSPGEGARSPLLLHGIDSPLEISIEAGQTGVFMLEGWAFCPGAEIQRLEIELGDERFEVAEWRHARHDIRAAYAGASHADSARALRCGFWVPLPLRPAAGEQTMPLRIIATLRGGRRLSSHEHQVRMHAAARQRPEIAIDLALEADRICICFMTRNPTEELISRRIGAIRAQDHGNWFCLLQDDASDEPSLAAIQRVIAGDQRLVLERSAQCVGSYATCARVLQRAARGPQTGFICLADQEDPWPSEKLRTLMNAFSPRTMLAYSSTRIAGLGGETLSENGGRGLSNDQADLESLFFRGGMRGAATLFRTSLLARLLPFPPRIGVICHDWWIALVALAAGEIARVGPLICEEHHSGVNPSQPRQARRDVGETEATGLAPLRMLRSPSYLRELADLACHIYRNESTYRAAAARLLALRVPESRHAAAIQRLSGLNRHPLRTLIGQCVRAEIHRRPAGSRQERKYAMAEMFSRLLAFFHAASLRGIEPVGKEMCTALGVREPSGV